MFQFTHSSTATTAVALHVGLVFLALPYVSMATFMTVHWIFFKEHENFQRWIHFLYCKTQQNLNKLLQMNLFPLLKWAHMNDIHTGLINIVLFIKQCEANPIESKSFSAWASLNVIWWSKWLRACQACVLVCECVKGIDLIRQLLVSRC